MNNEELFRYMQSNHEYLLAEMRIEHEETRDTFNGHEKRILTLEKWMNWVAGAYASASAVIGTWFYHAKKL